MAMKQSSVAVKAWLVAMSLVIAYAGHDPGLGLRSQQADEDLKAINEKLGRFKPVENFKAYCILSLLLVK
jgi:hypothetical protein